METHNLNLSDQATAFGVTDAPHGTAVVNKLRNPCRTTTTIILGAWNVRTTNDSAELVRPERATAIICRELEKACIDICALSEVRRPGTGNIIERSHTIFWSGGETKKAGVGFAINNKLVADMANPIPINDRLMTLRIQLNSGAHLTLISVYGPTMQRTQEEKEIFYDQLGDCLDNAKNDSIIILGDLNARVGKDWSSWPSVIGKHGVGNMNSNGLMLLEFCTRYQLTVMGTMFQLKNSLKSTWQHLRSKHWHQLDHVIANKDARQYIAVTKANILADCFTDHRLLVCKCKFTLKRRKKGVKPPKKLDTRMTRERKDKLEQFLDEKLAECSEEWDDFKALLQEAAEHTFDKKKKASNDWFDEQDEEIQQLLRDKKLNRAALRDRIRTLKNNWFQQKAEQAEQFAQEKNHREFYATLNEVYGPRSSSSHAVRSKDGVLLTSSDEIKDRWVEHFSELLNQPSEVDMSILDEIPQQPIDETLDEPITEAELDQALKNTKLGKSPGPDGVLPEVLIYGGGRLKAFLFSILTLFWNSEVIPSDMTDPNITKLFKKGDKSQCGNYRGISLLSVVGKVLADIFLQRLKRIAERQYPQSQSGYREGRSTIDGIFTLRQLMEKAREQRRNMYIAFVDFTKAFDTVNRELLYKILGKFGCPPKFIRMIKKLYSNVHARLIVDGELTEPFEYNSGVKQGCKLAPTLYGIYAAALLWLAYKTFGHQHTIKVRFRYDGNLFDLRRLKSKSKIFMKYIREAQYADDIAIFSDSSTGMQLLLSAYNDMAKKMGLSINITKTETICIGPLVDFYIDGEKLKNVKRFKYLGSFVTDDCSMKEELTSRIQAVSCAYGRLRSRVFDSHELTPSTKIKVYNQCLMPLLLYGCETWTLYHHQIRQLRTVQQRHLRRILKIKWDDYVSNEEVLTRSVVEDIEITLVRNRLRWLGHVTRMPNERPVKALLYGELEEGTRRTGRPMLRFKDTCKSALKCGDTLEDWQTSVLDRPAWRASIRRTCHNVNQKRINAYEKRKENRRKKAAQKK